MTSISEVILYTKEKMIVKLLYFLFIFSLPKASGLLRSLRFTSRVQNLPPLASSSPTATTGSHGVESAIKWLNNPEESKGLLNLLSLGDAKLKEDMERANFWTGGSFVVKKSSCKGILKEGLEIETECLVRGKIQMRKVMVPFPSVVNDETDLKRVLIEMTNAVGMLQCTADIARLPFGEDFELPLDFKWNEVPHQAWVRSYVYNAATDAVVKTVRNPEKVGSGSRKWQIKVNFPEVNPAYDTYRIGTILEMVRSISLALAVEEGLKVRICVQQSLGEGVFAGMPLALASMRVVLEKMDWGTSLSAEQKAQAGDSKNGGRSEALIRFGTIGANVLASDDDVIIVIAPQNVVGGMIVGHLEDMVKAANGRPVILFNPLLNDRPSSNGMMQIRGRAERKEFANSFEDIYTLRLLYPSSGGYMFPISGMCVKATHDSPNAVYARRIRADKKEEYTLKAVFPANKQPDPEQLSKIFTSDWP